MTTMGDRSVRSEKLDRQGRLVLVVADDPHVLGAFPLDERAGFRTVTIGDPLRALELVQHDDPGVIVADQRMARMSGRDLLERSARLRPDVVRIILAAVEDVETIGWASDSSVFRCLTIPWEDADLRLTLRRAIDVADLTRENARLAGELRKARGLPAGENGDPRRAPPASPIVGESAAIREVLALIARVADSRTTVLVQGETGTGKELVARAIHDGSGRRRRPLIAVNCAEFAEGVLESELFGHQRGAFTGAATDRKGLFELADGSTLFLDEVSEIAPSLQPKLLRVLQEGEVRRVGDGRTRKVDVRVIAATNRELEKEVETGRFRRDLYYRLRVFPIQIPPLRERREDIPILARHLLARLARKLGKLVAQPTDRLLAALSRHSFPGNVRELSNELERALLLTPEGAPLTEESLSGNLRTPARADVPGQLRARTSSFEHAQIAAALVRAHGVKTHAASELGLTYRGLLKKMHRLGL